MNVFWFDEPNLNEVNIIGDEHRHIVKSMRSNIGDEIWGMDGSGFLFLGTIMSIERNKTTLKIVDSKMENKKWLGYLHLAISLTKNVDRIEWLIEKVVELGVDEISILDCERSINKQIKEERIRNIIKSAMKQSVNTFMPKFNSSVKFSKLVENESKSYDQKFIPHCYELEKGSVINLLEPNKKTVFLIGPEGDFTMDEVNLALFNKFQPISLGKTRLRTETAGLKVACDFHLINQIN